MNEKDKIQKYFLELSRKILGQFPDNLKPRERLVYEFSNGTPAYRIRNYYSLWENIEIKELLQKNSEVIEILQTCLDFNLLQLPKMSGNPIENLTLEDYNVQHCLLSDFLWPLYHALAHSSNYQLSDDQLIESFEQYYSRWESRTFLTYIICPLYGLDKALYGSEIGNFKVVPFDDKLKSLVWNNLSFMTGRDSLSNFSSIKYVLYREKTSSISDRDLIKEVTAILSAFRLIGAGKIYSPYMVRIPQLSHQTVGGYNPLSDFTPPTFYLHSAKLDISGAAVFKKLQEIYSCLTSANAHEVEFAVRRYNLSFSRYYIEDKIVDLTICLEALLLHGMHDELKYRLSLYLLALLGKDKDIDLNKFAKEMYDLRSEIVHSNLQFSEIYKKESRRNKVLKIVGADKGSVPSLIEEKFTDVVRRVIAIVAHELANGKKMQNVRENLESKVLQGLEN